MKRALAETVSTRTVLTEFSPHREKLSEKDFIIPQFPAFWILHFLFFHDKIHINHSLILCLNLSSMSA